MFPIPGMVTLGSELGPAGPKNKIQHLAVWRKMISQTEIPIWLISFHLANYLPNELKLAKWNFPFG